MIEHQVLLVGIGLPRIVEQETEVAGVDPEERHAAAPVLANGPQHGAVAADHHDQLGFFVAVRCQSLGHCAGLGVPLVGNHQVAQPVEPESRLPW